VFGELPGPGTVLGAALILLGTLISVRSSAPASGRSSTRE
jgi:hypothetical protein